jgi:hypothetical protein
MLESIEAASSNAGLSSTISSPRSPNLVFTSAGDRSNVRRWLTGKRNFDLWVVYYGDGPGVLHDQAEFYVDRKGSKFQNLHYCYRRHRDIFDQYEAIMIMDDDILIDGTSLSRLFDIRRELDLWVLQPAFRLLGKISWDITRVRPTAKLRYTNFVEMTCPLFRRDKLAEFMLVYDPRLVGYGMDWWFLDVMGEDLEGHVAIVDEITCVNPYDRTKGGKREIDRLQPKVLRKAEWEGMQARHGIRYRGTRDQIEFRRISKPRLRAVTGLVAYFPYWAYVKLRGWARRILLAVYPAFRSNEPA